MGQIPLPEASLGQTQWQPAEETQVIRRDNLTDSPLVLRVLADHAEGETVDQDNAKCNVAANRRPAPEA